MMGTMNKTRTSTDSRLARTTAAERVFVLAGSGVALLASLAGALRRGIVARDCDRMQTVVSHGTTL